MTNEAETIAKLAVKADAARILTASDGRELLILPPETRYEDITDPRGLVPGNPARIKQSVTLQTAGSLADYVNAFKTDTSVLFADIQANSISALIDYHGQEDARNVEHRATMALPFSEEWKTWTAINDKLMEQLAFARFIEENAADVVAPSGADLLEVVRDLQARRKVDFTKAVRTASDNENFEFSDTTETRTTKGSLEIPTKFQLSIPVYFGEPPVYIFAFLRWRLVETSLSLGIVLHRAEHVRQAVFKQIVQQVAEKTDRSALFGKAA